VEKFNRSCDWRPTVKPTGIYLRPPIGSVHKWTLCVPPVDPEPTWQTAPRGSGARPAYFPRPWGPRTLMAALPFRRFNRFACPGIRRNHFLKPTKPA
jgi:hypothetical protein